MENSSTLREWFSRVDAANTGNITAPQLKSALAVGNLDFPLSVVQQMIRMYDFDRNGTMSFEEFLALNKFLLKVQQAFSDRERGRGYLVTDDVHEALVKIGFLLDTPAFYTVCESFDQKKKGMFRLDDFISLCIFLQSARNLFNSFDTAKQGRVTLDLNQFVYCILGFLTSIFSSGRICRSLFELWLEGLEDSLPIAEYEMRQLRWTLWNSIPLLRVGVAESVGLLFGPMLVWFIFSLASFRPCYPFVLYSSSLLAYSY